ncbi:hypothetical protein BOTBODRAFT_181837 [Botryobasidium botryosum FD-172 SS1]|uniref:Uncharacterized protein n=1 Tax=Botryobasidium botryosum (strain FD-172 SS1) TaxID=930990 RepID=A0A067LSE0_BOTB1|nr:hypothetical protein BOTBODRAFT_181837 [Botryobasidium botryosum FD-172 SS1]
MDNAPNLEPPAAAYENDAFVREAGMVPGNVTGLTEQDLALCVPNDGADGIDADSDMQDPAENEHLVAASQCIFGHNMRRAIQAELEKFRQLIEQTKPILGISGAPRASSSVFSLRDLEQRVDWYLIQLNSYPPATDRSLRARKQFPRDKSRAHNQVVHDLLLSVYPAFNKYAESLLAAVISLVEHAIIDVFHEDYQAHERCDVFARMHGPAAQARLAVWAVLHWDTPLTPRPLRQSDDEHRRRFMMEERLVAQYAEARVYAFCPDRIKVDQAVKGIIGIGNRDVVPGDLILFHPTEDPYRAEMRVLARAVAHWTAVVEWLMSVIPDVMHEFILKFGQSLLMDG